MAAAYYTDSIEDLAMRYADICDSTGQAMKDERRVIIARVSQMIPAEVVIFCQQAASFYVGNRHEVAQMLVVLANRMSR